MYENFGMSVTPKKINYGVTEWVKCGTLRWFEHIVRINEYEFVKSLNE